MVEVVEDVRKMIGADGVRQKGTLSVAPVTGNRVSGADRCRGVDAGTRETPLRYAEPDAAEFVLTSETIERERFARWLD